MLNISPTPIELTKLARTRRAINVHARLLADRITMIGLYATLYGAREGTFLLESVSKGAQFRYSFVGARCGATLTECDERAIWLGRELTGIDDSGPLDVLHQTLVELATPAIEGLPSFHVGMVGYLGCDVVRRLETLPDACINDLRLPKLAVIPTSQVVVLDHGTHEVHLTFSTINYDGTDEGVERAYHEALVGIGEMAGRFAEPTPSLVESTRNDLTDLEIRQQRTPAECEQAIRATIAEIEVGEALQVVVSRRFDMSTDSGTLGVHRTLRLTNPSPYLYLLRLPGFAITGSSSGALITIQDGVATTRPIAGSRPRDSTGVEDRELAVELLTDPKERAGHLMLADLGRSDLGRIYKPGSVTVHEFVQIYRCNHIMHLEAAVSGRLAEGRTTPDTTLPCFLADTLSGAPKVRAAEVIDQLEVGRRGLYDGMVGYFGFVGSSDVAIVIRTAVLKNGITHVQAGAGIVADFVPGREDAKCSYKAATVITAFRRAAKLEETT